MSRAKGFNRAGLRRDLLAVNRRTRASARAALGAASIVMAEAIRATAPERAGLQGDGRLVVGLARAEGGRLVQSVLVGGAPGPDVMDVEFGTAARPAEPFFRRATAEAAPVVIRLVEGAIQ